jgi:homoserine O-acetyltransferase
MGAGQTYQWAVTHPEMVQRMLPFCGSPRTAPHNKVFLDSLRAALTASVGFDGGWYLPDRWPVGGLRAFARIYAGWGFSQAFYWDEVWRELGFTSLEDFAVGFWEAFFLDGRDPNNLLTMLDTWWHGDVGATPGFSSTEEALASVRARAICMPAEKDLYFPPEDERWAVSHMTNAELRVIPGVWGHFAGGGPNPVDTAFIDTAVRELLAAPSGI